MKIAIHWRLLVVGVLCLPPGMPAGLSAQKPPVDTTTFRRWLGVANPALSPDGAYALYTVQDPQVTAWVVRDGRIVAPIKDPHPRRSTLVIQALRGQWKRELPNVGQAVFTADSRHVIGRTLAHDSLVLVTVGRSDLEAIPHVRSFQLFRQGKTEWLAYEVTTPDRSLVLRQLATGQQHTFPGVQQYVLSADGRTIVLQTDVGAQQAVSWVRVADGTRTVVWEGTNAGSFVLDSAGTQLAFLVTDVTDTTGGNATTTLWHYRARVAAATRLLTDRTAGLDDVRLAGLTRFSRDGGRLFGSVAERAPRRPAPEATTLTIWSYTDARLQSEQLKELQHAPPARYDVVVSLAGRPRMVRLQRAGERTVVATDDYVMLEQNPSQGNTYERNWNIASQPGRSSFALVSTRDGQRRALALSLVRPGSGSYGGTLSPDGKYIVGRDAADIYAYDVAAGVNRNLTQALPIPLRDPESDVRERPFRLVYVAGWLVGDAALLVYDRFDLWQVDPAGQRPPINLTNGYGRRHNLVFRLPRTGEEAPLAKNASLILSAFSRTTKDAGFYRITLGQQRDPERLTMGPYRYGSGFHHPEFDGATLVKARDANVYLIHRESASESPNYFWTTDFCRFAPLSDVHPEREYNWLISELVTFRTLDGRLEQGALYKPENFDSTKQYPVIFNYYERKTHELNAYRPPTGVEGNGEINVSWFVSHGYLVFRPDIRYTIGKTGESIVNSVVGAAEHLAKLPWVDGQHMGIQGQSFGGYATNYLVTHSQRFAAAMSGAGFANLISSYGDTWFGGQGWAEYLELRRGGMGATPWEEPERYIANSPIFAADRVTTPVLMMHNRDDGNVRFHHGLAFFLALRRLGKRAWMLEYENGGHDPGLQNAIDYTRRITQFFDHYLKGAPAPRWMTRGIPAAMKGLDDGFALDEEISTPGPGLVAESDVAESSVTSTSASTAAGQVPVVP